MTVRTALLLSFIAGTVFGAAALWLLEDSSKPAGTRTPGGAIEGEAAGLVATGSGAGSTRKILEVCSEELERMRLELTRERERIARLSGKPVERNTALREPLLDSRDENSGQRIRWRKRVLHFDAGALQAIGFAPDDIEWIHGRWQQAELEKSYLAELEARDQDPPSGGGYSDIERELREDLGDNGYDAMLHATDQNNRVSLGRVKRNSIAYRAGIRDGSVVWSYDGQRVYSPEELATLSTTGARGEPVEIVIVTDDGTQKIFVERNPLGADLVDAKERPNSD